MAEPHCVEFFCEHPVWSSCMTFWHLTYFWQLDIWHFDTFLTFWHMTYYLNHLSQLQGYFLRSPSIFLFSVDQARWLFIFSLVSAFIVIPLSIFVKSRFQLVLFANCIGVPLGAALGLTVWVLHIFTSRVRSTREGVPTASGPKFLPSLWSFLGEVPPVPQSCHWSCPNFCTGSAWGVPQPGQDRGSRQTGQGATPPPRH